MIYKNYPVIDNRTKRNKIILGIFICQGITTDKMKKLQTNHINLKDGRIFIPGSKRSNSRKLDLKPSQILDLHEYITQIRSEIQITETDQLFVSMEGNENLKSSVHHLFRALKK